MNLEEIIKLKNEIKSSLTEFDFIKGIGITKEDNNYALLINVSSNESFNEYFINYLRSMVPKNVRIVIRSVGDIRKL